MTDAGTWAHFRPVRRHHHRPSTARGSGRIEPALFEEFYATINRRLRPDGILQQWLPYGDAVVQASVARALFPIRVFHPVGGVGFHFGQQPTAA
jgi:hypothetical protein